MPISNIQTDETYTSMKKYLFLTLLAAAFLAGGGCSSSDDDGWGVIELASPKLKVTTELATATVTWDAVAKTAGYAYALDGAADYTSVDAATTTVTLTALAEGGHTFRLKAVGDLDHTTDSAERTIDFEIDPTLPQPAPTYVKGDEIGSVVVSWPAVKGAAGYAYKFGEAASFTEVGADVLSVTQKGLSAEEPIRFTMYAVGQLPDSKDSEPVSLTFQLVDTSEGVWVRKSNGELFELTESEAKIYTGTVSVSAADSFEILVENVPYGFLSYSGNGGVGTVNNDRACVPFYTYPAAEYYVRRSLGRMASDPLNKFWINLTADARIDLRIDCTQDPFRYDLQLVEADDPALILAQYFDLMVYGGDWIQAGKNAKSGRMGAIDRHGSDRRYRTGREGGVVYHFRRQDRLGRRGIAGLSGQSRTDGLGNRPLFRIPGLHPSLEYSQLLGKHVRDPDHSQTHGAERPDEHHAHLRRRAVRLDVRYSRQGAGRGNHKDSQRAHRGRDGRNGHYPRSRRTVDRHHVDALSQTCQRRLQEVVLLHAHDRRRNGRDADPLGHDRRGRREQGRPHLPGQHRDPQELTNELHNRRSAGSPCLPIVFRTIRS